MAYIATTATHKLLKMKRRIRLTAGGTSAGKTISILQILIDDAQTDLTPTLTSVVSESFPHLRKGAMRDFQNIMQQHGYWKDSAWSKTEFTYTFPNKSKIEFFSADQPGKVRGPRRDRLLVNESNNVHEESWEQLLLRTREYAFADWNPVSDFHLYETYGLVDEPAAGLKPYATDPDTDFVILTYRDNEALEPAIVNEIEKRSGNKQWYRTYGLGLRGETEGKIFTGWKTDLEEIPHEARLERRGLDFGYSNDPTVIVDIYYYNGGYILDEVTYRTGMLNKNIADMLLALPQPNILTVADSAEPKSIDDIKGFGVPITGVEKKPGYAKRGTENSLIDWVQTQQVSITKRSVNLIKSYRNFMWKTDKDGKILNEYDHFWSDGMMAAVYGLSNFQPRKERKERERPQRMKFHV